MTTPVFIPGLDDVRRAQAITGAYTRTRLEIIAARPGNPMGAEVRQFDGAVALRAPGFPGSNFNRAHGFCDDHIAHIPGLIDWYAAGVGGSFDLAPGRVTVQTAALLAEAGYRLTGFHATLVGPIDLDEAPVAGVEIEPVEDETALQPFADVYHRGWDITSFRVPMTPWLSAPGWRLYLARVDSQPAGAAILYLDGDNAYLADGAVDPDFRDRGVHRMLLDRRVADAKAAGARRIYCGADFLSASYRNQLRMGLVLLYTEALLTGPQPKAAG